jgi:sugar phosphate isomerase/epimerase
MQMNRRSFLGSAFACASAAALPGCCSFCGAPKTQVAVQLYSIRTYIMGKRLKDGKYAPGGVGLEKALEEVARIGYKGVEMVTANFNGQTSKSIDKMLKSNGLVACGVHVGKDAFGPDKVKESCEFNLGFGNNLIICPGGGNRPSGIAWDATYGIKDDWWKYLTEYYAKAAEDAAKFGCKIGLHNHSWEFQMKLSDGTTVWDYFFKNTPPNVCMEQDVGWTTAAGYDPCEQYVKYPHRSPTLHAKENGCVYSADNKRIWADQFDAILGQPGKFKDGRTVAGVDWDRLFKASDADGVKWYVVECEKHED